MKNPLRSFAAAIARPLANFGSPDMEKVPVTRRAWIGPRFDPGNISATAKISDVQTATRDAENGDPTSLFRFYRDSLLGDELIQGELNKRKLAVIGETLTVLPETKDNPEDIAAAAACMRAIKDCKNWLDGLSEWLNTSIWPVTINENIFSPADPKPVAFQLKKDGPVQNLSLQYTLSRLEPVNPMLFCFRHAYLVGGVGMGTATPVQQAGLMRDQQPSTTVGTSPWYSIDLSDWEPFLRLWPIDQAGRIIYDASRASKLDPMRYVVHRGHLLTGQRDNWGGPGRAITGWWLLRGLGRDWFARFMERYGSPFPVGKTDVEDPQSVKLLEDAFATAVKIGGLVIGQDDSVDLKEAAVQGGADGHDKWHRVCNDAISFHLTGRRSSDKPAGLNSGESQTQENIREDIRLFDEQKLAETLVKQLFENFKKINGLAGSVRVVWGGLSADDAKTFADLLKTMSEAGYEPTDEALPTVEEKTGLQWQRKAVPDPLANTAFGNPNSGIDDNDPDALAVRDVKGRLILFSAGGHPSHRSADPIDPIVSARLDALTAAYRGAMAPFRQAILDSSSKEECLARLKKLYADWSPGRLQTELETALQICAAAGAAAAKS